MISCLEDTQNLLFAADPVKAVTGSTCRWRTTVDKENVVATETWFQVARVAKLGAWQTPDLEILQISATASGRGSQCEGSTFTNTS